MTSSPCFSTLYGSKWVATWVTSLFSLYIIQFQYPLRVEVGCNDKAESIEAGRSWVSVPSTGRSGLQRALSYASKYIAKGFSTLYGSKWVATRNHRRTRHHPSCFSTLYGSKWVATKLSYGRLSARWSFSTLYGSKWVATGGRGDGNHSSVGFSTLYGSKWVATRLG